MPGQPPAASIVIPTRRRPHYLEVTLASIAAQAAAAGAEVIVVNDGDCAASARVAERHGARVLALGPPGGANAARNAGVEAAAGDLIVLIDDDVRTPEGWLASLLRAAAGADADVFGGPIHARLEGGGPRSCGREGPPITALDLGPVDRDVEFVWSANMAIRRPALERVGHFDETLQGRGEEEDWERRYRSAGGVVRYVAAAGLDHRRAPADATLIRLSRAGYAHGRNARHYDVRKGTAPSPGAELRTLAGCLWHIVRRRCANGVVMAAHSAGRLREMFGRPVR